MTDHVVEPLSGRVERGQVALLEADVLKRQFGNPLAAVVDVSLGQIDAAEARSREPRRQRDDVSSTTLSHTVPYLPKIPVFPGI